MQRLRLTSEIKARYITVNSKRKGLFSRIYYCVPSTWWWWQTKRFIDLAMCGTDTAAKSMIMIIIMMALHSKLFSLSKSDQLNLPSPRSFLSLSHSKFNKTAREFEFRSKSFNQRKENVKISDITELSPSNLLRL